MNRRLSAILFSVVMTIVFGTGHSLAQSPVPAQPSIVTTGVGHVEASLATATLQFLLGSSSLYGASSMAMESVEVVAGTPGPAGWSVYGPTELDEQTITPVVQAIVAAGVAEESIEVTIPAGVEAFGPGTTLGEVLVVLDPATKELVEATVAAVRDSAAPAGLTAVYIGISVEPADCPTEIQRARDAAIADARQRAEGLAASLGGSLGGLIQASEVPYYGFGGMSSCGQLEDASMGAYGPGTLPTFNARSIDPEIYVEVTLTFGFEPGA